MGEEVGKSLGAIHERLTRIEAILDFREKLESQSSIGPRVQNLEVRLAAMQGRMMGIGAAAGLAVSLLSKFIQP